MGMRSFVIMFFHTAVALLRAPVADVRSFIGYDASDSFKLHTPFIAHGTSFAKHLSAFPRTADVLQGTFDPPGTVVLLVERVPRLKSPVQPYLLGYRGRILHKIFGYLPERHLKVERFLNIYPVILCKVFMIPLYLFGHVVLLSDAGGESPRYSKPSIVKLNSGGI